MHIRSLITIMILMLLIVNLHSAEAGQSNLRIAMVLWRGETDAERGFRVGLAHHGYNVAFDTYDAKQDKKQLGAILRQQINISQYDYIYTFGTTVSLQTKSYLNGRVPQIFNIVADPLGAGLVKSLKSSGGNLCGVKSGVPLRLQIENAHRIIGFKRLGYIFNPREKNSNVTLDALLAIARDLNFQVVKLRSPPVQDRLMSNLERILTGSERVDAVYLPSDSYIVSNADAIASLLLRAGIPAVGAIKKYISAGALMGSVADYSDLGRLAAGIVHLHQKGNRLENIPIQTLASPKLIINSASVDRLSYKLPEAVMKKAVLVSR